MTEVTVFLQIYNSKLSGVEKQPACTRTSCHCMKVGEPSNISAVPWLPHKDLVGNIKIILS